MKASDVMSQEVVAISPTADVAEAARLMLQERISGLPVIDASHNLVGVVTEGDLLRRVEAGTSPTPRQELEASIAGAEPAAVYLRSHSRRIADVMTTDVVVATEDTPLEEIAAIMESEGIKRLPVMRGIHVVGMVSRANILQALMATAPQEHRKPSDAEIREALYREMGRHPWCPRQTHILVENGSVHIWGYIKNDLDRNAVRVATESATGVTTFHDHLLKNE